MKIIEWKPIKSFDGYFINELGEVKSTRTYKGTKEKILKSHKNQQGYLVYTLMRFGKPCLKPLHRLLMETFKPNKEKLPCINHIDGNKENNNISNLEWCTRSENIKHAYKNGLHKINKHNEKKVKQIDVKNEIILNVFDSVRQIEKILGFSSTNISKCCRKEKNHNTAYGYKWEYIDEVNKLKEND